MKSLKALLFVAMAMFVSGTSWAMESKATTATATATSTSSSSTSSSSTSSTTAIVEYKPAMVALGMDLKVPTTKQATGPDGLEKKVAQTILQTTLSKRNKKRQREIINVLKCIGAAFSIECAIAIIRFPNQLKLILKGLGQGFSLDATENPIATLCHEAGHAVAYLLCGANPQSIQLYLFSDPNKSDRTDPPMLKLGFIHCYLDSANSYAHLIVPLRVTRTGGILSYSAGGIAELCFLYYALLPIQALSFNGTGLERIILVGLTALVHNDMAAKARYAFFPTTRNTTVPGSDCDGSKVWCSLLDLSKEDFKKNQFINALSLTCDNITGVYRGALVASFVSSLTAYICDSNETILNNTTIEEVLPDFLLVSTLITATNLLCSLIHGRPTTIVDVAWDKVLKPQLAVLAFERRVINDFTYNTLAAPINLVTDSEHYAPYPKAKITFFMQAMYRCLRNKVLAQAGSKLQQAGTWTKQKGSQALDTAKGWFGRKPKAA